MRNVLRILGRVLGTVWASPVTLLGLFYALLCKPKSIRWNDWAIEVEITRFVYPKWAAAQCYGSTILYRKEYWSESMRSHEIVHMKQGYLLGPFMLTFYLLGSLLAKVVGGESYRHNPFELQAYALQKKDTE